MPLVASIAPTQQNDLFPSANELKNFHANLYGDVSQHGWRVQLRHHFGYYAPSLIYQFVVDRLVNESTEWIDIGGGKTLFPENRALSYELSERCDYLFGVDPSDNIHSNDVVHSCHQGFIEEFESDRQFDLATFRMVAEHIENPARTISAIDRLLKPGGHAVIYTPNKWSPVAIIAGLTPFWLHPPIVKLLSNTVEEDVFPTVYKMNTRTDLASLFSTQDFEEVMFAYLDNTATFQRFKPLLRMELAMRKTFRAFGSAYPENALLGVYRKPQSESDSSAESGLDCQLAN